MAALMQTPPQARKAIGEQARQQVVARFSLEAALDRWEALYAGLLRSNPQPRRWGRTGLASREGSMSALTSA
jgi:hypothetical protein